MNFIFRIVNYLFKYNVQETNKVTLQFLREQQICVEGALFSA